MRNARISLQAMPPGMIFRWRADIALFIRSIFIKSIIFGMNVGADHEVILW